MRPLLSVVIPFYNVEKYIAQCLDSVFNQDIPEEEYEVICVNDASPDHSRSIVLEYQKKHSNLVLVEHDDNRKLGAARNTGRKVAQGKYIWNVDSDDIVEPNCFGCILNLCESKALDVLIFRNKYLCGSEVLDNYKKTWKEISEPVPGFVFWKDQCLNDPGVICPVWNKVFRKDYLDEKGIYSPEINMGEDVPFSIEAVLFASRVFAVNEQYYIHRDNAESLTRVLKSLPSPQTIYENSFVCGKSVYDVERNIPTSETEVIRSLRAIEKYVISLYDSFIGNMSESGIMELRRICGRNVFANWYVFTVLGYKKLMKYLGFILLGCR